MTNHVHLLVTPEQAKSIPRIIIALGRRYVQYINTTYHRTGTLWDSRYKSSLIQVETYLLVCQQYIELNPVRAAMVDDPAHYRWTSYRYNALGQANAYLTQHIPSTWHLATMRRLGRPPIEVYSVRISTATPSATFDWH